MPLYPYMLTFGDLTCKSHHLYLHMFKKVPRIELLNVLNHVKRVYLVHTGEDLPFSTGSTCEGDGLLCNTPSPSCLRRGGSMPSAGTGA